MVNLRDRSDIQGHCAICEYKALCGGCRARAYTYFGNLKVPDPECIFNKEYYYETNRAGSICDNIKNCDKELYPNRW